MKTWARPWLVIVGVVLGVGLVIWRLQSHARDAGVADGVAWALRYESEFHQCVTRSQATVQADQRRYPNHHDDVLEANARWCADQAIATVGAKP